MNWEDECFLLSKSKFRENANIINVFSKSRGKVSGLVYGGTSRKIRNYLQLSNKLFIMHNSKSDNKLGYFKTELLKPISPLYFNDKERTTALLSLCSILNVLLPEAQPNEKIYKKIEFTHPYYDQKALDNQKNLKNIQNKENLLFCGSYFGYGFHEDGIKSSIEMLKNLNE